MTTKEEFLSNIAARLGRGRITSEPKRTVKGAPEFWRHYFLSDQERVSLFAGEVEKLGGHVSIYRSLADLHQGLDRLLNELNPPSVLAWESQSLGQWELDPLLKNKNRVSFDEDTFKQAAERSAVGITAVDYAIAGTGTLVLCTSKEKARSVSLLPVIHIALVRAEQIRNRMGEVLENFSSFQADRAPSSIHFVSGPSRSSDIENDLSIGVHGPVAVYVLILDESFQQGNGEVEKA